MGTVRNPLVMVGGKIVDLPAGDSIPQSAPASPTGTGFPHVTGGNYDGAAKLVDTADINDNQVTLAKLAQIATAHILGRTTAATGDVEALTAAQVKTLLAIAAGDVSGLATVATTGAAADVSGLATIATTGAATDLSGTVPAARLPAFTGGDVTSTVGTVLLAIATAAVTNAKLADMVAHTFKARNTNSTGAPEDITVTQATALLNAFVGDTGSGGTKGLVPAPGAGDAAAGKFLRADATFAVPSASGAVDYGIDLTYFGDGGDGALNSGFGSVSLTRDMFYTNVTPTGADQITLNGWRMFVSGTLDIANASAASIRGQTAGANGGNATVGGAAGSAGTTSSAGSSMGIGQVGTIGHAVASGAAAGVSASANAAAALVCYDTTVLRNGGNGGNSSGHAGGLLNVRTAPTLVVALHRLQLELWRVTSNAVFTPYVAGCGGPGGGSGGSETGGTSGPGGGGGSSGGIAGVFARTINRGASTAVGAIQSNGGNGGNGATGANNGVSVGGGGGGSGGNGGLLWLVYRFLTGSSATGAVAADGGTGGSGGNGLGTGGTGAQSGYSGDGGIVHAFDLTAGTLTKTLGTSGTTGNSGSGATGGAVQSTVGTARFTL